MEDSQIDKICQRIIGDPSIRLVIGRQGSGKTLVAERLKSLRTRTLFAFSFSEVSRPWTKAAMESCRDEPIRFWSGITTAAVTFASPSDRGSGVPRFDVGISDAFSLIERLCTDWVDHPLLLIYDSVDLIPSEYLSSYVNALFEHQRVLVGVPGIRPVVFCRPDLVRYGPENMEQFARVECYLYL